jgi:hypothetical protein
MSPQDSVTGISIPVPEPVTWAGESPTPPGFSIAFGSEEGRIWLRAENGEIYGGRGEARVVESGEAINAMAIANGLTAVSTRSEVVFHRLGHAGAVYRYDGGAHGVIATPSGRFIAPLGPLGVLVVGEHAGQLYHKELITRGRELYFYRLVSLGINDRGDELIAGACRHGGIVAISLDQEETASVLGAYRSPGRDIIDVCAIGGVHHPHAIASLGSDGSVHLCSDLLDETTLVNLRFPQISGTGYAIRSGRSHLFVLTSEGIYIIPHLVNRFLEGQRIDGVSTIRHLEVDAFDISVVHERWLLTLRPGAVNLVALDQLWADELGISIQQPVYNVQSREAIPAFDLETVLV